jgi:hypothetical protein
MSEAKFTKGPWVCKELPYFSGSPFREYEINRPDGWTRIAKVIVSVSSLADDYAPARDLEANAHLIAAAPELYEALQIARDYVAAELEDERQAYKGYEASSNIMTIEEDLSRADAALAKARGESLTTHASSR